MYVKLKVLLRKIYVVMDTNSECMSLEVNIELHVNMYVPNAHINRKDIQDVCCYPAFMPLACLFVTKFIFLLISSVFTSFTHYLEEYFCKKVVNNIGRTFFLFIMSFYSEIKFYVYAKWKENFFMTLKRGKKATTYKLIRFHRKYDWEDVTMWMRICS
jgi:hypothetical protein